MLSININIKQKKFVKTAVLYIIILLLLIEVVKMRQCGKTPFHNVESFQNKNNKNNKLKNKLIYKKTKKHIKELKKEQFKNKKLLDNHNLFQKIQSIHFANKELSKSLFENSDYLNNMNKINIHARNLSSREELKHKYMTDSLTEITDNDKEAFVWLMDLILDKTKNNKTIYNFITKYIDYTDTYNTETPSKLIIAKNNEWLEYDMPHTHENVIIFSMNWFKTLKQKFETKLESQALSDEGTTFIHELIHIDQRYNKKAYEDFYTLWGFKKVGFIHNINDFLSKNRNNPDGNYFKWVWNNNGNDYIIGAIYNSDKPQNILDVSYILKELKRTDNNVYNNSGNNNDTLLYSSNIYMDYFGILNNHYHPNEIMAQYMEYYYKTHALNKNIEMDAYKAYNIFNNKIETLL